MNKKIIMLVCAGILLSALAGCDSSSGESPESVMPLMNGTTTVSPNVPDFVPDDKYIYKYENGAVIISDTEMNTLLTVSVDVPIDSSMSKEVLRDDYNFDGYTDFSIMYNQGNANSYYYFWLYDKTRHNYIRSDALSNIPSPRFDKQTESISSYDHISASDNIDALYVWQDGVLKLVRRKVRESVEDGLRFTTYITDENNNESVQKTFTISIEAAMEMENVISRAEDVAKAQFDVHKTEFTIEYLGTKEIDGALRHEIALGQAYEIVATLYPKVGDFEDMLAINNLESEKLEKVDVNKTIQDEPKT